MKFATLAIVAASAVSAQVTFDNGDFKCLGSAAGKNFCAGDSLKTNIIIRCTGEKGQPGNCNDNLAGIPPVGVKFADCYQTSNTTGDAACSFQGIVYPDGGEPFPIPGFSSSSSAPVYPSSTSSVAPPPTYLPPGNATTTGGSTMATVTATTTTTTCPTTSQAPTGGPPPNPPAGNATYSSTLPIPTQGGSGAGSLIVRDGLVLGAVAFIGFLLL
ncbi:hypothetical protein Dda_9368 [Drechslerella dactyloides]|uniref:Uncharacterized protein n=1 Tax=Drechslerella dactyloides TaxID=74499 RepID=A0AAD6NF69_DREDA|nr:hypothetical protein Dda_9368 [Drechslerella dactyloides]